MSPFVEKCCDVALAVALAAAIIYGLIHYFTI